MYILLSTVCWHQLILARKLTILPSCTLRIPYNPCTNPEGEEKPIWPLSVLQTHQLEPSLAFYMNYVSVVPRWRYDSYCHMANNGHIFIPRMVPDKALGWDLSFPILHFTGFAEAPRVLDGEIYIISHFNGNDFSVCVLKDNTQTASLHSSGTVC